MMLVGEKKMQMKRTRSGLNGSFQFWPTAKLLQRGDLVTHSWDERKGARDASFLSNTSVVRIISKNTTQICMRGRRSTDYRVVKQDVVWSWGVLNAPSDVIRKTEGDPPKGIHNNSFPAHNPVAPLCNRKRKMCCRDRKNFTLSADMWVWGGVLALALFWYGVKIKQVTKGWKNQPSTARIYKM